MDSGLLVLPLGKVLRALACLIVAVGAVVVIALVVS